MIVLRNKEFADPKNIDRLGKVLVYGSAGAALGGLGYGGYKLYKNHKEKKEKQRQELLDAIKNSKK